MPRLIMTLATLGSLLSAALAQGDVIAERKSTMKMNGAATKAGADMVKGEAPFDLARAQDIFRTYQAVAQKMPALFPENSRTGDTAAAPRIWEDMAGFKAGFDKLARDAAAALSATRDLDTFKAAFGNVTKNCAACHETYRLKKG